MQISIESGLRKSESVQCKRIYGREVEAEETVEAEVEVEYETEFGAVMQVEMVTEEKALV